MSLTNVRNLKKKILLEKTRISDLAGAPCRPQLDHCQGQNTVCHGGYCITVPRAPPIKSKYKKKMSMIPASELLAEDERKLFLEDIKNDEGRANNFKSVCIL